MWVDVRLGVIADLKVFGLVVALSWVFVKDGTGLFTVFVGLYLLAATVPAEEGIDETLSEGTVTSLDLVSRVLSSAIDLL